MARWLTKPGYAALAETHDQFETPWGAPLRGPWSLCPADPGSLALVRELLNELLPHFSSRLVNINCDEPVDVGQGRSRALVAERGLGRVYLDWVRDVVAVVQAHGRKAQVWSDIIVEHPELVGQLPPDTTVLVWGYEADHPFAAQCALFGQADIPFYVCPGTSSWRSIAGRTHNALANTRTAAEQGLRHAAIGYLLTDWGDCGHWQQLPVSYLPFTAAAAYSWCLATNGELDVAAATSRWALRDETGVLGRLAYTLGDLYRLQGDTTHNGTAPFAVLQQPLDAPLAPTVRVADNAMIARALDALDAALNELPRARPRGPDAALLCDEWAQTGRMLRHALHRTQLRMVPDTPQAQALRRGLAHDMADLIDEQQRLWLARNRPGGLNDSLAPLKRALHEYQREVML
jgi:hexosaminidase